MDMVEIGKFIALLRKERMLSQEQLGKIIGVTNKTISRWETGTYVPPVEMLLTMSKLFDVSINELLSGRRLGSDEYVPAAEENLRQTIKASSFSLKEKITFYKKKWLKEHIISMCCCGIGILAVFAAGVLSKCPVCIAAAMILLVAGHMWRNHSMMAYVERNAFDETDKNV